MNRRNYLISTALIPVLLLAACGTTVSIAVGLLGAASVAITELANAGAFPAQDKAWVLAASQFTADSANELDSADATATKITTILADFTKDFAGVSLPAQTNIYITAAVLAIDAFEAFIKSQQSSAAAAVAHGIKPAVINMASTPDKADKKALATILTNMKAVQAKLK